MNTDCSYCCNEFMNNEIIKFCINKHYYHNKCINKNNCGFCLKKLNESIFLTNNNNIENCVLCFDTIKQKKYYQCSFNHNIHSHCFKKSYKFNKKYITSCIICSNKLYSKKINIISYFKNYIKNFLTFKK
jgi:hypothetical protein